MIIEFRDNKYGMNLLPSIVLTNNATNGDVIKAMFPNVEFVNAMPFTDERWESMIIDDNSDKPTLLRVYKEWWNAPYMRGE